MTALYARKQYRSQAISADIYIHSLLMNSMSLSSMQATSQLGQVKTPEQLRRIISELNVTADGVVTVLYSGMISVFSPNNSSSISAKDLSDAISESSEEIRMIDKTEAAMFLDIDPSSPNQNRELVETLIRIFGDNPNRVGTDAHQFLYGEFIDGKRIPNGVWDSVSSKFVIETVGEVRTITGGAQGDRVFAQTEVPAILESTKITHVDGIPIEQLRSMTTEEAFYAIRAQSEIKTAELRISVDDSGKPVTYEGNYQLDTRKFFADTPGVNGTAAKEGIKLKSISDFIPSERIQSHRDGADQLRKAREELLDKLDNLPTSGDDLTRHGIVNALDRLGTAADIIEVGILALDIKRAHDSGDTEEVRRIITNWTIESIGAYSAGKIAAMAVAPLIASGPPGLLIAAAITLTASVAGGVYSHDVAEWFKEIFNPWDRRIQRQLLRLHTNTAWPLTPLILDLNGDGVRTRSLDGSSAYFDHDNNGFAENTGWISAEDGFLVRDIDSNGKIDSGRELFGNNTLLDNGRYAANGFEALAALDNNGDGHVDFNDDAWNSLQIWLDSDADALVGPGELISLQQAGVLSLNTEYINVYRTDDKYPEMTGNQHLQVGSYTDTDGKIQAMTDVWFAVDPTNSVYVHTEEVSKSIAALPNVAGLGNVSSLHQSMQGDESGQLQALVEDWVQADREQRETLLDQIIYRWTGVESMSHDLYHPLDIDAREFIAFERFLGVPFQNGKEEPGRFGAINIKHAFNIIKREIDLQLTLHSDVAELFNILLAEYGSKKKETTINARRAVEWVAKMTSESGYINRLLTMSSAIKSIGSDLLNSRLAEILNDEASKEEWAIQAAVMLLSADHWQEGTNSNDHITSKLGDSVIDGQGGDDFIYALNNDTLHGGEGDDFLWGKTGNNVFVFGPGDGNDTIGAWHDSRPDKLGRLQFKPGVDANNLNVRTTEDGEHLLLQIEGTDDQIIVYKFIPDSLNSIAASNVQEIRFADGQIWSTADVLRILHAGSDSHDHLRGSMDNDSITGGQGNDTINGLDGNDTLAGDSGDDILLGGHGADVFLFFLGDGSDRIVISNTDPQNSIDKILLGNDILRSNVAVRREDYNLHISISDQGDSLSIDDFFKDSSKESDLLVELHFSDGSVWNQRDLINLAYADGYVFLDGDDLITGDARDEHLFAGKGHDTITGHKGNDTLDGGEGYDTYLFARGDGNDTIITSDTTEEHRLNTLTFTSDITSKDIELERVDEDLMITIIDSEDSILVSNFFFGGDAYSLRNPVQRLKFQNEGHWSINEIVQNVSNIYMGTYGHDFFRPTSGQEFIFGYNGNDRIRASTGNDVLDGGEGIDTVYYTFSRSELQIDLSDSGPQVVGDAGIDTLISIENLYGGRGDDWLRGNMDNNRIDGRDGDDTIVGSAGNDILIGGSQSSNGDTISYENAVTGIHATLLYRYATDKVSVAGRDRILGFENLVGSNFDDTLIGDVRGNLINGLDGNDLLQDNHGADTLTGGQGADTFRFDRLSFVRMGVNERDVITDFEHDDTIDLSKIDANRYLWGNEAFQFIGSEPFKNYGQLRYTLVDGIGVLEGNTHGDLGSNFEIHVLNGFDISEANLVL